MRGKRKKIQNIQAFFIKSFASLFVKKAIFCGEKGFNLIKKYVHRGRYLPAPVCIMGWVEPVERKR